MLSFFYKKNNMLAKREEYNLKDNNLVWIGKYRNSQNSLHWHDEYELIYVEKGYLNIFCDSSVSKVSAGETAFINSKQIHYTKALTPETEIIMFILAPQNNSGLLPHDIGLSSYIIKNDYHLKELYDSLKKEMTEKKKYYQISVALKLALCITHILQHEKQKNYKQPKINNKFINLFSKIETNYADYSLEQAANDVNLNVDYFSRTFHEVVGITFTQYLNLYKVNKAIKLIHTKQYTMTEIVTLSGFMTIRNFNLQFKKITGYSPKNLPKNYIFTDPTISLTDLSENPTFSDCILLEDSNNFSIKEA